MAMATMLAVGGPSQQCCHPLLSPSIHSSSLTLSQWSRRRREEEADQMEGMGPKMVVAMAMKCHWNLAKMLETRWEVPNPPNMEDERRQRICRNKKRLMNQ